MSELAIAEQLPITWDSKDKLDLLRKTIASGVTENEFELFIAMARSSGLDPFQRQIYAVARQGKMTVQTGIDGYRLIADRTGKHMGTIGPIFTGEGKYPDSATVTVKKFVQGHIVEFSATCYWEEYAPIYNGKVGAMWEKMPKTMLGKVAEALALRRAFPANLSGLYTSEEMSQADVVDVIQDEPKKAVKLKEVESVQVEAEYMPLPETENKVTTEELESLVEVSKTVAEGGIDALKEWFKGLSKSQQDALKPLMSAAKAIATKVK